MAKTVTKTALIVVANGSEEIEVATPIDALRRAKVEVTVAGLLDKKQHTLALGAFLVPDTSFAEATASKMYDAIILPGGWVGSDALVANKALGTVLKKYEKEGKLIAAICAAPTALKEHGICLGKPITSFPGVKDKMVDGKKYDYKEDRVVVAGNLITSRGPGTALEWSIAIIEYLLGKETAQFHANDMLLKQ